MRTALMVVDMLNDFVDGVLGNPAAGEIVGPIAELAARARSTGDWVVVYANDAHHPDDFELRVFPPHAMAGTEGARVIDALEPQPGDEVVPKRAYSAFTGTSLAQLLAGHEIERLVLVGQHTDCCVRHTAYDAFTLGLELLVCPEATTVYEPASHEPVPARQQRALEYLTTFYGAALQSPAALF